MTILIKDLMETHIDYKSRTWQADLEQPLEIGIPLMSTNNPNCYGSPKPEFSPVQQGDFIGSISKGGPVNHFTLKITPHGNGTHTECLGHISDEKNLTIGNCLKKFHFLALVITINPESTGAISREKIASGIGDHRPEALVIRTAPNKNEKLSFDYTGNNPPYLDADAASWISRLGIDHLLVDLPSVDPEVDGGRLAAHKQFWGLPEHPRSHATITELIFVPVAVPDGLYLLNLQVLNLESDASPSRPVLYELK